MVVSASNGFREPGKGVAFLAATRLDDRQQAARRNGCPQPTACTNDSFRQMTACRSSLLGRVVGRLDPATSTEGPQPVAVFPQLLAEAGDARVEVAARNRVSFYLRAERSHLFLKGATGQRAVADFLPQGEQLVSRPQEVVAENVCRRGTDRRTEPGSRASGGLPSTTASGRPKPNTSVPGRNGSRRQTLHPALAAALRHPDWCGRRSR